MGISSITSANSMSVMQMTGANSKVQKSKSIQNEITNAQQQIRKLSSQEDLSAAEKANERKKLQKEISGLNTELKQHQDELSRSQRREILMAKPQEEEKEPEKEDRTEDKIQSKETSSDTTDKKNLPAGKQQAAQPGTVISQNNDGTVIFKGALNQDKNPAIGTENKQAGESNEKAIDEKEEKNEDNGIIADSNLSSKKMYAMTAADSSLQQAGSLGTIIAKTNGGIAILKGEIKQDENLGADTERKQAELEKMEKQAQRATAFQFSILGDANNAVQSATESDVSAKAEIQNIAKNNISSLNLSQEEQTLQQQFNVSIR